MITNTGITLLGKYLIGQIPSFASHIAVGCGPDVLGSDESIGNVATLNGYATKSSLDFEMDRFPVVSRTTNVVDGEQQVIFTAEIPSDVRFGITEVGIYPAESNNIVGSTASQTLFSFTTNEVWQKSLSTVVTDVETESDIVDGSQVIDTTAEAFFLASDNAIFRSADRLARREQPRFLNNSLVLVGDFTALSGGNLDTTGDHIRISQPTLPDLDAANIYSDEIKVAFSVISKTLVGSSLPSSTKIKIIFSTDAGETATYSYSGNPSSDNERYVVNTQKLSSLSPTAGFAWKDVTLVKIFANATNSDNYIALDGIRFENISSVDDRYSLSGYTVLKSEDTVESSNPVPVEKPEGLPTYVEFRFVVDVV